MCLADATSQWALRESTPLEHGDKHFVTTIIVADGRGKTFRRASSNEEVNRLCDPTPLSSRNLCFTTRQSSMVGLSLGSGASGKSPLPAYRGIMADLLRRVAEQADSAAFRELYETFGPRVKAYMMRKGADPATAEDLAQETLLTVWRKAALYAGDKGSMTTWVFTIARNLRIDRLRREVPWQELPEGRSAEASSEALPDELLEEKERSSRVQSALDRLPSDQREVVVLAYIEGLSQSEIATRLELPLGTVKSRMRIAYQKVRTALEGIE
jgi:RNA polymerase sigma-70 factor, ECF subfamily